MSPKSRWWLLDLLGRDKEIADPPMEAYGHYDVMVLANPADAEAFVERVRDDFTRRRTLVGAVSLPHLKSGEVYVLDAEALEGHIRYTMDMVAEHGSFNPRDWRFGSIGFGKRLYEGDTCR